MWVDVVRHMPFRMWDFVVVFETKILESSLSGLETSSGPLVFLLSLGPPADPKKFSAMVLSLKLP